MQQNSNPFLPRAAFITGVSWAVLSTLVKIAVAFTGALVWNAVYQVGLLVIVLDYLWVAMCTAASHCDRWYGEKVMDD
ncbi:hypothetical protein N7540_013254 [Penicillium herquei]|nr:hypothetical protein N7540_013254 [Penicillium herquei]